MGLAEEGIKAALNVVGKDSGLLGMLFPYAGINKKALDVYINEIEKSNLPSDIKVMAILNAKANIKKLKNRKDIADIALINAKEGTSFSEDSGVNVEWYDRFMESAGFVSDEQVKEVWGKILAKEFEKPGSTPSNMIRILSELSPTCAQAFRTICSMRYTTLILEDNTLLGTIESVAIPYNNNAEWMVNNGLSLRMLNELEAMGLIKYENLTGFINKNIRGNRLYVMVGNNAYRVVKHKEDSLPFGNVMLTTAGECLRRITPIQEIEGYDNVLLDFFERNQVELQIERQEK